MKSKKVWVIAQIYSDGPQEKIISRIFTKKPKAKDLENGFFESEVSSLLGPERKTKKYNAFGRKYWFELQKWSFQVSGHYELKRVREYV